MIDVPIPDVLAAARSVGIERVVTVGTDLGSSRWSAERAAEHDGVYAAVAIHPNEVAAVPAGAAAEIEALAGRPRVVAVGETGLDYYRDYAPREDQERAFAAQISLARATGKPLVIHTRAADDDTLAMLSDHAADLKVILHCFSMPDRIDECLSRPDWWISFAGNVTYPKAGELRSAALRVPADRLLVETDAPYLSPQTIRGKPNEPARVVDTAQVLALERRVEYSELEATVEGAAAAVFGW
jgi:TatD DNase family protein